MNPGNRYTRLAKKPINPRLNNGTIAGGLAHALESGLKGYAVYKADQDAKAKKEQTETRLAAALNEFLPAPQATKNLADDPLAAGGAPTQAGYDTRSLAAMLMDPATAPVGQAMFAQMTKGPDARKTAQDAAGYLRYLDDGTRVFPDATAPKKAPTSRNRNDGLNTITEEWNPATGAWETVSTAPRKLPDESGGPFRGTGLDAQAMNILLQGDPNSPAYAAAWAHYSQPRVQVDPKTGATVTVRPDMSHFRPPAGMSAAPTVERTPGETTEFSADESKAAGFSDRMSAANAVLDNLEGQGTDATGALLGAVPFVGNYLQSPEYQQFDQARRDFINAQLRRESGAAIAPSEFESANKQYFPQPGDGPEVIAQKREARRLAIQAMKRSAGEAYKAPQEAPKETPKESGGWSVRRID